MSAGQLPREMYSRSTPSTNGVCEVVRNHRVRNDEVRRTTGQPRLSAIVQARRLPVGPHCVNARRNRCQEDLNSFPIGEVEETTLRPRTTWMKTTQQELKSHNLSLNEAIDVAQNRPLWRLMSTFGATTSGACQE